MNINYQDFYHDLAEVEGPSRVRFYATEMEKREAKEFRKKLGPGPVVLWSLAGSSIHKAWPWVDQVAAWLLRHSDAKIVMVGGQDCQVLESAVAQQLTKFFLGMEHEVTHEMKLADVLLKLKEHFGENRILCKSGSWKIRQSLAFIDEADCVVGPETGLLNAASMLPMAKVLYLSHSSHENLTRDWINTTAIAPEGLHCYPCHQLHPTAEFCNLDEHTHAALCAYLIRPETVFEAIMERLQIPKAA